MLVQRVLSLVLDFRLMCKPSYIYFKMLDCHDADIAMINSSMRTPVLYHAMLYGATAQRFGTNKPLWTSMPSALKYERMAVVLAQEELDRNHSASEELVFATALMALTEVWAGNHICSRFKPLNRRFSLSLDRKNEGLNILW